MNVWAPPATIGTTCSPVPMKSRLVGITKIPLGG